MQTGGRSHPRKGEVTFGLGAIGPNLRLMPAHLLQAMPMLVLGLIALAWIIVRRLVLRRTDGEAGAGARRDLWVGIAVAASWFAIWGLLLHVHLDDRPDQRHCLVRQVLPPGDRRDRPARRLARDQASRPYMARRPYLNRRHDGVVRPRRLGLLRHVRGDHVGFAVADYQRSKAFYEKALAPLGMTLLMEFSESAASFGKDDGERPSFFIEAHGEPVRGRLHIALTAENRAQVDAFHAAALEAGGIDNGAPGLRWHHLDYYVLDPDS